MDENLIKEILKEYTDGKSSRELAQKYGCSNQTILNRLHEYCDKNNIKLQKGETISFKWISKNEFIEFVNSDKMIDTQKRRYTNWLKEKGYLR